MHGVVLDAETLGPGLELAALAATLESWDWHDRTPAGRVAERIAHADVVVTNKVVVDAAALAAAPRLALVCVAATGVNNVDLDAAAAAGVTVCNTTGYATPAVAQHTWALILALATHLVDYRDDVRAGAWSRAPHFCRLDHPITELAGATLGIIGHGTLGRAVAAGADTFAMEVLIAARPGSASVPPGRAPLREVLERADVLSLHCPLTDATDRLIDAAALARMKDTALLINTARGGIVDPAALADALRNGAIAGAGVDVLEREPPVDGDPLLADNIPNLIVTPHCAWGTRAARQRLVEQLGENIAAFRAGAPCNMVTPEAT